MHLLVVKVTVTVIFVALVFRYLCVAAYAEFPTISAISAQTDYYNFAGLMGCCLMLLVYRVSWLLYLQDRLWRRYGYAERHETLHHQAWCDAACGCQPSKKRWKVCYSVLIVFMWIFCTLATIGVFGLCVMGDRPDDIISEVIHGASTFLFFAFEWAFQVFVIILLALTSCDGCTCQTKNKYCAYIVAQIVKCTIAVFIGGLYIAIFAAASSQPPPGITWLNRFSVFLEFSYIFAMTTFDFAEILRNPLCYPRESSDHHEEFFDELAEQGVRSWDDLVEKVGVALDEEEEEEDEEEEGETTV